MQKFTQALQTNSGDQLPYCLNERLDANFNYTASRLANHDSSITKMYSEMGTITTSNASMNQQITSLNAQIQYLQQIVRECNVQINQSNLEHANAVRELQNIRDDFGLRIAAVSQVMETCREQVQILNTGMSEMNGKMAILLGYVPRFVRTTSQYFVTLLTHIKTDTLDQIRPVEYPMTELIEFNHH